MDLSWLAFVDWGMFVTAVASGVAASLLGRGVIANLVVARYQGKLNEELRKQSEKFLGELAGQERRFKEYMVAFEPGVKFAVEEEISSYKEFMKVTNELNEHFTRVLSSKLIDEQARVDANEAFMLNTAWDFTSKATYPLVHLPLAIRDDFNSFWGLIARYAWAESGRISYAEQNEVFTRQTTEEQKEDREWVSIEVEDRAQLEKLIAEIYRVLRKHYEGWYEGMRAKVSNIAPPT